MESKFLKFSEVSWMNLNLSHPYVMEWDLLSKEKTHDLLKQCESLLDDAEELENNKVKETFIEELIQGGQNSNLLPPVCQKFLDMITPDHKVFQQVWDEETVWLLCK